MTEAAIEWWGKAGDQALRRSAFQEAIAHLGRAIEMADKTEGAASQSATPEGARVKLQTSFGKALLAARGDSAPETTAAFVRARELAAVVDDPMERLSFNYGLWTGSLSRGEAGRLREIAEVVLRDIEGKPPCAEAGVAHRLAGTTEWYFGNFELARAHLERTLAMFNQERDRDLTYRLGRDVGVSAMVFMALTLWPLGETDEARRIGEEMLARAVASGHMLTTVYGHFQYALLHVARRDAAATAPLAEAVVELAREHGMPLYTAYGEFLQPWARWHLGDREGGLAAMRRGIATCHDMGNVVYTTLFETALAEAEAEAVEIDAALATIDHAVALTERTGQRWCEADTHRVRGEILLKRDQGNTAPAEEAFLTAIAVAQHQQAKSFELRAALSLAKLYHSTGRAADAHAVLAPALEGFAPTPEFPEIQKARALLAAMAQSDEVKSAAVSRQRRLQLQTSYGQAMIHARGYSAPETAAAFARARELTAGLEDAAERFSIYYGLWVGNFVRGELAPMRDIAEIIKREVEARPRSPEAGVAARVNGATDWFAGNFADARVSLERALAIFDPERDSNFAFRFAQDLGVSITAYLALVLWPLGEVDRAREIAEGMVARATKIGHVGTAVYGHFHFVMFEMMRRNPAGAAPHTEAIIDLARAHAMPTWTAYGGFLRPWSRRHLDGPDAGLSEMRAGIAACRAEGMGNFIPFIATGLAEAEVEAGEIQAALATIDRVIADSERTGQCWFDAESHRIRAEILLKRDPANWKPAEGAFLTAIAIAQQQKARSFELRAATSMARRWRDQGKRDEAHELLAPVYGRFTEGFDTRDLKEAKALLEQITLL